VFAISWSLYNHFGWEFSGGQNPIVQKLAQNGDQDSRERFWSHDLALSF
jgi:hypothetical protein